MTARATLRIRFTSYWVSGTGQARGRHADAITDRDGDGFPVMAMSQVRGQLRETAQRLARHGGAGWPERFLLLFGSRTSPSLGNALGQEITDAGHLRFEGYARLPPPVRAALRAEARTAVLYRRIAATRINLDGVAQDKTLRAIEAAVPMTVEGFVSWRGPAPPPADWVARLDEVCAATLAFGKLKSDGYGRALAECVA